MKTTKLISLLLISFFIEISFTYAQTCPENIGFEQGIFSLWKTSIGTTSHLNNKNVITITQPGPVDNRHTLLNSKTLRDPYGDFPVLSPNGSGYAVKLGNDELGSQADRLSYLINVPADKPAFNITYQYAVVFENPVNHENWQQPRFTAKVLDVATNTYLSCSSFEYVATANLPGFKMSTVKEGVLYKDWSAVNINLSGYQGKQILIEFTAADCTESGHFGYAYIDINENCENIIQGSNFCEGTDQVILKGPSGYKGYVWYNANKTVKYGEGETITIKPALPIGDKIILDLVPFDGFGCANSLNATIEKGYIDLQLANTVSGCKGDLIDLTSNQIILNKSAGIHYNFYADEKLQKAILDPTKITISGKYYIKATAEFGCSSIKSIDVNFNEITVDVLSDIRTCTGNAIDLTSNQIQKQIPSGLTVSYYEDALTTKLVSDPKKITQSGDYYIKYQSQTCATIKKISVTINALPVLKITKPIPDCAPNFVDLTNPIYTEGSDKDLTFSYFKDADLKYPISNPTKITTSETIYIKAINNIGCWVVKPIAVEIYPLPILIVKNPNAVCYPSTVDITDSKLYIGSTLGLNYSFYDNNGKSVTTPTAVAKSGVYLVSIKNEIGCSLTKEIVVTINPIPNLVINQPKNIFINQITDLTKPEIIAGSKDYEKIYYWKDATLKTPLLNPNQISISGTYYISLANSSGCITSAPVNVVMVPFPKIVVPTAFTPLKDINNKLYPFFEGIKKLVSFKVINKWGNIVFEMNKMNPSNGWDGYYKGSLQPFETYSWFAEGINELNQTYVTKGKTILIP